MSPRVWAILLVVMGIALAVLGGKLRPGRGGDEEIVGFTGGVAARYDRTNDTTLLVTKCAYCERAPAYIVAGDATDLARPGRFHLRNEGPDREATRAVDAFIVDGKEVTTAFAGPFVVFDATGRLAILVAGLAVTALGILWLLVTYRISAWTSGVPLIVSGLAWGWFGATGGDGGIVVFLVAIPLAVIAGVLLMWRRARPHAAAALLAIAISIVTLLQLYSFYPSTPAI